MKQKHPTLLLTKQWNVLYPKGFHAGNNIIPVVSGSKKGKHLVAELNIFLPDNLELDLNSVELVLKNEPYTQKKKSAGGRIPRPIDEPLDTLNDIILSVNQFLQNIHLPESPLVNRVSSPQKITPQSKQINIKQSSAPANVDEVKKELLYSPALPEWYRTIESPSVKADLAQKLAESFVSYQQQLARPPAGTGRKIEFVEFFNIFSEHLKTQNKLHHYCRYKGQPVKLDSNSFCTESFCSKKPYNSVCNQTTLKFGEP
ncbi:MAG: hypothetical protein HND50_17215 [Calditrichaeota bacterium]|nr:hypothetical protein [Calditrichota bacterium]